jgi:hypothetical protein
MISFIESINPCWIAFGFGTILGVCCWTLIIGLCRSAAESRECEERPLDIQEALNK